MDILSLVEEAKKEHLSFEKHPAIQLDIEQKTLYLNGLALLMNVDEEMHEKEKEYLTILIRTFDLPDEKLEELIQFAKKPSKKAVLEIFDSFKEKNIKYVFMFDALMLAHKDENFNPKEQKLIDDYFEALKISPREKEQVQFVYEKIIAQDKEALFRFFMQKDAIKRELYEYLLEYYGLGSESKEEIERKYKEEAIKIINNFNFKTISYIGSSDYNSSNGESEVLEYKINNKIFKIFLQYLFDTNKIVVDDNLIKTTDGKTLFDLTKSTLKFKLGIFEYTKNEATAGFSLNGALKFIEWLNSYTSDKFSFPKFNTLYNDHDYGSFKFSNIAEGKEFVKEIIYEKLRKRYVIITKQNNDNFIFEPKEGIKGANKILDGVTFRLQKNKNYK